MTAMVTGVKANDGALSVTPDVERAGVEPVTNANDGMNRLEKGAADTGVWVLDPGQALAGQVRFQVEGL